jgi:hypothetical protein
METRDDVVVVMVTAAVCGDRKGWVVRHGSHRRGRLDQYRSELATAWPAYAAARSATMGRCQTG